MLVTKGKNLVEMNKHELNRIISIYERVILDIGAGSGKFIYRLAKENQNALCVGLETSQDSLLEYARRIEKKPERGGLSNVIYVIGNIESHLDELCGIADEVFINYPWTNLLKALVVGDNVILQIIHSLLRGNGNLNLTMSYDERYEKKFIKNYNLPELSEDYVRHTMAVFYEKFGFKIISVEKLGSNEMQKSMSEWGKRLAFGRERIIWKIQCVRITSFGS
jgi:SAM-dependent methyltransferase